MLFYKKFKWDLLEPHQTHTIIQFYGHNFIYLTIILNTLKVQ